MYLWKCLSTRFPPRWITHLSLYSYSDRLSGLGQKLPSLCWTTLDSQIEMILLPGAFVSFVVRGATRVFPPATPNTRCSAHDTRERYLRLVRPPRLRRFRMPTKAVVLLPFSGRELTVELLLAFRDERALFRLSPTDLLSFVAQENRIVTLTQQ